MKVNIKALVKGVATHILVQREEVGGLNKSLEGDQGFLESTEEHASQLKNDVLEASVHLFEEVRRRASLLYPHLDLSPMVPFRVIQDGELIYGY